MYKKLSSVELLVKAKRQCKSLGMSLNHQNRDPLNSKTMTLFCGIASCKIYIYDSNKPGPARKLIAHYDPPNGKVSRPPCHLRVLPKRRTYSLLQPKTRIPITHCPRCKEIVIKGARAKERHDAFCSQFAYEPRATNRSKTLLTFPKNCKYRHRQLIKDKLQSLSVDVGTAFDGMRNMIVYDVESYSSALRQRPKKMLNYSETLSFGSVQKLAMISCSFRYSDDITGIKTFFRADSTKFIKEFLTFILEISKKNTTYLKNVRFVKIFSQLDKMAQKNNKNGFLSNRIELVRKSLDKFLEKITMIGWNSGQSVLRFLCICTLFTLDSFAGTYDMNLLVQNNFFPILTKLDGNVKLLKKRKRYLRCHGDSHVE